MLQIYDSDTNVALFRYIINWGASKAKVFDIYALYSLLVEIKVNRDIYFIDLFYSPRTADAIFFDSLHTNIEKALDTTNSIIILGDERRFT